MAITFLLLLDNAVEHRYSKRQRTPKRGQKGVQFSGGKVCRFQAKKTIDPQESDHFAPSSAPFMVNYRVEDLHALVKVLKEEGCNVLEKIDESEYGKFAWVIDPEGNKVELWQPPQGQ
jgi:predicted enzyme related to lactoylglutathione lyase